MTRGLVGFWHVGVEHVLTEATQKTAMGTTAELVGIQIRSLNASFALLANNVIVFALKKLVRPHFSKRSNPWTRGHTQLIRVLLHLQVVRTTNLQLEKLGTENSTWGS